MFSCDIAYSGRPAAARAASRLLWLVTRLIQPQLSSKTNPAIASMSTVPSRPGRASEPAVASGAAEAVEASRLHVSQQGKPLSQKADSH
jgi:hypothetical protein